MQRYETVDEYIAGAERWQDELVRLREILGGTVLEETVKWGAPAYTHEGKLVVGIGAFKEWVALWFHQGALLEDPDGVLINAQEGTTKALRQWRFTGKREIKAARIKAYVKEAVALQEAGQVIKPARRKPLTLPAELVAALKKSKKATAGFEGLSLSKQREYADHVAGAKRAETRAKRLQKVLPMIAAGVGLNDRYRG